MPLILDVSISVKAMKDEIIVVGRYRGGGYEKDFNLDNAVLSVEGVCRCINAHVGKGTPPIIVVKGTEGWKKKDKPK